MYRKISELNSSDGYPVTGVRLDSHNFLARMKAAQLLKIADDPRRSEDPRQREGNTHLENFYRLRMEVQRLFEGAKKANVEKYSRYIVAVHNGQEGMTPPIILYSEQVLPDAEDENGAGAIQIPWDVQLVAIDGETQLAARHEAANIDPATKDDIVPVIICHGRSIDWARQVFHDLNLLAVKPNAAVGIGMDQRDPLTHVARVIEREVPFFRGRVNTTRRQLRRNDKELVTITTLRGACVTLAEGIRGVKHGAKPVFVEPAVLPLVQTACVEWFDDLSRLLGAAMENRETSVAASPAVFAALGAVGHVLSNYKDAGQRKAERDRLLNQLRNVNWDKGQHWEGIAGKFTPKGEFSLGGPKENAYATYTALTDATSPGYARIRYSQSSSPTAA